MSRFRCFHNVPVGDGCPICDATAVVLTDEQINEAIEQGRRDRDVAIKAMQGLSPFKTYHERRPTMTQTPEEWTRCIDKMPPIGVVVRVLWSDPQPSDRKTAKFDGIYWWTARGYGLYDEHPVSWRQL